MLKTWQTFTKMKGKTMNTGVNITFDRDQVEHIVRSELINMYDDNEYFTTEPNYRKIRNMLRKVIKHVSDPQQWKQFKKDYPW